MMSLKTLSQTYLLVLLLLAAILAPLPYSPAAIALLLVTVLVILRPAYHRLRVIVTLLTLFLLPLALEQLTGFLADVGLLSTSSVSLGFSPVTWSQAIAAVLVLPAIYLLDLSLIQSAQSPVPEDDRKEGRSVTATTACLFLAALVMIFVSIVITSPPLFLTGIIFFLYLAAVLVRVLPAVPALAFDIPVVEKRVIAGDTVDVTAYLVSKSSSGLVGTLVSAESWVRARPVNFNLDGTRTELLLTVVPPLAGPSRPRLRLAAVDKRGLVRVDRRVEPVALQVIPRARYAEWLAMKYLEQAGRLGGESLVPEARAPRLGTEYLDSRGYQAGDEIRHIDWKHTAKLNQLTVKEFVESGGQTAIIGVNLSVVDAEEADKLAFDLITTALTLAQEMVPTALAAYNHEEVVRATAVIDPRNTLRQSMELVNSITMAELTRLLQPASLGRLRYNMSLLRGATSQPAQQLLNILDFEYRAIEKAASGHPATVALLRSTERVPAPASVVLVSRLNHDAEAIMVATEKLQRRGFAVLPLGTTR
ncbi:MAG TPA: DUF58 domain-containing protein [Dehalococcoidia bacterium]|nr:DUF58 domain-containing protein [Dehalococcoidia bacterium]